MSKSLGVGIAGLGTVGGGFLKQLKGFKANSKSESNVKIVQIAVKNIKKKRNFNTKNLPLVSNALQLASNKEIDVIVELIGGSSGIAYKLVKKALSNKKHVITANKALIATHGNELAAIAEKNNVCLNYEAAIAGGVPIVKAVRENLRFNKISKIYGILNGTCNYILTKMSRDKRDFKDVLKDAQKKGFAELDPTFDIQGIDAAHKISILSSLAFNIKIDFKGTYIEGISKIDASDFLYAKELGYSIKLLAIAEKKGSQVEQRVHPCFVKQDSDISKVDNELNAIVVNDNVIGSNIFEGPGAGAGPTGASVMSDLMDIHRGTYIFPLGSSIKRKKRLKIRKITDLKFSYYLRILAKDQSGVMASITKVLSYHKVSIESIIQKPSQKKNYAEIILIIHSIKESTLISALKKIKGLNTVSSSVKLVRIEDSLWQLFQHNMLLEL